MGRAALIAGLALGLGSTACGGDDDRPGGGGAGTALHAVPREWAAEERLGYAVLSLQTRSPTDLTANACALDAQVGAAVSDGGLPESASMGTCIVTDDTSWRGHESELAPTCAGVLRAQWGATTRNLTLCDAASFAPPLVVECAGVGSADAFRASSGPDEIEGDELAGLDATVARPGTPAITRPAPQGEGTALWPEGGGDLVVEWDPVGAEGMELVVGQISGTGPQIRCLAADSGTFAIPAALLAPYRSGTTFVELAALRQSRTTPAPFTFRTTFRVSTAIWLYP